MSFNHNKYQDKKEMKYIKTDLIKKTLSFINLNNKFPKIIVIIMTI